MARVIHRAFGGMRPGRFVELLNPGEAALAVNTRLNDGSIEPILGLSSSVLALSTVAPVKTVYRFGQLLASETSYWFETANDADFVKGPIADNTDERTYYTGVRAYPAKTNALLATGAPPQPTNGYRMGLVRPGGTPASPEVASTFAPAVTVTGSGSGTAVTVIYTAVYVSEWGEESAPSASSATVTYTPGQTVTVTLPAAPTGNYNVTAVRLYRSNTGANATQFQRVAEISIGTPSYVDAVAASALGEVIGSAAFHEPADAMKGLTLLPNGAMMGFFDNQLCFCEPGYPHAWPIRYRRSMGAPIVALGAFDSTVLVFTNRGTYVLNGSEPANMVEASAIIPQVCLSKRSVRKWRDGVVFASKEGLCHIGPSGVKNLTAEIMAPEDWAAYAPSTVLGLTTPTTYVGFFDTGVRQAGFVLRFESGATFTETDIYATAGYLEPSTSVLFVAVNNTLRKWESGAVLTLTYRSGTHREPAGTVMSSARVEAAAYPLTFKFYRDNAAPFVQTVVSDKVFRLPGGLRARKFAYEITSTGRVSYVGYASTPDELSADG